MSPKFDLPFPAPVTIAIMVFLTTFQVMTLVLKTPGVEVTDVLGLPLVVVMLIVAPGLMAMHNRTPAWADQIDTMAAARTLSAGLTLAAMVLAGAVTFVETVSDFGTEHSLQILGELNRGSMAFGFAAGGAVAGILFWRAADAFALDRFCAGPLTLASFGVAFSGCAVFSIL